MCVYSRERERYCTKARLEPAHSDVAGLLSEERELLWLLALSSCRRRRRRTRSLAHSRLLGPRGQLTYTVRGRTLPSGRINRLGARRLTTAAATNAALPRRARAFPTHSRAHARLVSKRPPHADVLHAPQPTNQPLLMTFRYRASSCAVLDILARTIKSFADSFFW